MGSARWNPSDWATHAANTATQTQSQIFRQQGISPSLNPLNFGVRESCDSAVNPESTPIILAVDETGSMGHLAEEIIKNGLGVIMKEIYDRKPVTDPHVMCCAVGDAYADRAPIQATQFEAGVDPLVKQIKDVYIEGNGGGNGGESYGLAWYMAAYRTRCDAIIKRHRKGYLFTIGDEPPHMQLTRGQIKTFFGDSAEVDFQLPSLLDVVSQNWEVFHLRVNNRFDATRWKDMLGERCMDVFDTSKLAEVIVSTIQVVEGANVADVVGSWSGDTSLVVQNAVRGLRPSDRASGIVAL